VTWLYHRLLLVGNGTEAVFTFCFVKRPLGFPILLFRNNSDACNLLSSLFPLSFPNPYISCQARILTRERSKRSYWHSTRVLAWSGLVATSLYPVFSRFVPNYQSEGQARSHAIREVLGIMAAVGRKSAGTKYRADGLLRASACVCVCVCGSDRGFTPRTVCNAMGLMRHKKSDKAKHENEEVNYNYDI